MFLVRYLRGTEKSCLTTIRAGRCVFGWPPATGSAEGRGGGMVLNVAPGCGPNFGSLKTQRTASFTLCCSRSHQPNQQGVTLFPHPTTRAGQRAFHFFLAYRHTPRRQSQLIFLGKLRCIVVSAGKKTHTRQQQQQPENRAAAFHLRVLSPALPPALESCWVIGLTPRIEEDCRSRLAIMAASAVVGASTASIVPTGGAGAVAPAASGAGAGGSRTARRKQRCWLFQVDGVTSNGELAGQGHRT